jgi:hypothetical protein
MAKRIRRNRRGVPENCIFCARRLVPRQTLSGEHLWSDWMKNVLPLTAAISRREQFEHFRSGAQFGQVEFWERHGSARNAKLHVICVHCNNGWMSDIDKTIIPIMTPLIKGEPAVYTPQMQEQIANWIALKMLVFEKAPHVGLPSRPIILQSVRDKFMRDHKVPPRRMLRLVIQHHPHRPATDLWRKLVRCLARHGSTFSGVGASDKPGAVHCLRERRPLLRSGPWGAA